MTLNPETVKAVLEVATPGPWTWETESGEWTDHSLVGGAGDCVIWWDFDLGFRFDNGANARLIAMAPDLAAAYQRQAEELRLADAFLEAFNIWCDWRFYGATLAACPEAKPTGEIQSEDEAIENLRVAHEAYRAARGGADGAGVEDGGPAFPYYNVVEGGTQKGMSLRDYFAGQALAGMLSNSHTPWSPDVADITDRDIAAAAYDLSDAMLASREAKP